MEHSSEDSTLESTHWRLTAVDGAAPQGMRPAELQFEDGRVSGSGGCNRLVGGYTVSGDRLDIGQLASTRMACPPPAMQQEDTVLRVLGATPAFRITGTTLELSGDGIVLRFEEFIRG
jgi:heat shock protein HslJ